MEKLLVTGLEGRTSRGRSATRWSDQVRFLLGVGMHESSQVAQDRDAWRVTVEAATAYCHRYSRWGKMIERGTDSLD